ncbi:MAG: invasion associated locus B family protein [Pseudomonadota bacterium]
MPMRVKILMSVLVLGLAGLVTGPIAAQDTTPETTEEAPATETPATETPATETPAAEAPAAPGPASPEELDEIYPLAEAEQPREVVQSEHGDWQVRCNATNEEQCFMYQLAKDTDGRTVAEFTLIKLPDGSQAAAGATVVTGLGVALPRGLSLIIDSAKPLGYPYLYCVQAGCFSRLGLTAPTITRLKRGAEAKIAVVHVTSPDTPIIGTLSLTGFTAAYDALKPATQ